MRRKHPWRDYLVETGRILRFWKYNGETHNWIYIYIYIYLCMLAASFLEYKFYCKLLDSKELLSYLVNILDFISIIIIYVYLFIYFCFFSIWYLGNQILPIFRRIFVYLIIFILFNILIMNACIIRNADSNKL